MSMELEEVKENLVLKELVDKINERKIVAESNPGHDPMTRRVKLGHVNRAKEDLKDLFYKYRTALQDTVFFILVSGNKSSEFADIANEEFGCYSLDADKFYEDILNQVPERLYTNTHTSPTLFDHFSARFGDVALDMDIIGHPPLTFETKYKKVLMGKKDALEVLKRAFNAKVGGEVVGLNAVDKVARQAINENHSGEKCAILLHSNDSALILELERDIKRALHKKVFVVSTGTKMDKELKTISLASIKDVNTENVGEALVKIRNKL